MTRLIRRTFYNLIISRCLDVKHHRRMTLSEHFERHNNCACAALNYCSSHFRYALLYAIIFVLGMSFYFSEYSHLIFRTYEPVRNRIKASEHRFYVGQYSLLSKEKLQLYGHFNNDTQEAEQSIIVDGLSDLVNQIKPSIIRDPKLLLAELPGKEYFSVSRKVEGVDCSRIFHKDEAEAERASQLSKKFTSEGISPKGYIDMTRDCSGFKRTRGYVLSPLTKMEEEFPIAFSLLMFKHVEQAERIFRAIYRPQNFYCFHVDKKSDDDVIMAMESIAACFDNVVMTPRYVDVQWGRFSVLEPELMCMEELWKISKAWKYFINLTGQEFPLKTNNELVRILQAYRGANDIAGTVKRANKNRWKNAGSSPPHNLTMSKGSVHITANRDFVDFVLHDPVSRDLQIWLNDTSVPDETFFSTLNHNAQLGIPGSYLGLPETDLPDKPFMTRFKNWGDFIYNWPCQGKWVRQICVLGVGDLPLLASRAELFVNKFHYDYERYAFECMEELMFNRTKEQYLGLRGFDTRLYEKLGFVLNKI